jgi:thioesterase domain-containing protein
LVYRDLIEGLDPRIGVITVQDPVLVGMAAIEPNDVPHRAQAYWRLAQSHLRPGCKTIVAGWSFGALLAMQIAYVAEQEGRAVHRLVMIDPPRPDVGASLTGKKTEAVLHAFTRELNEKLGHVSAEQTARLLKGEEVPELALSAFARDYVTKQLSACVRNLESMRLFVPPRLSAATLHLMCADHFDSRMHVDTAPSTLASAWSGYAPDVRSAPFAADHYSILRGSALTSLLAVLHEWLASESSERPRPAVAQEPPMA